ncbi:ABC transporter permease [Mycoplasma todarodis]|uniref:ABC transporter permease n=1 Tax=Mycoplasma todarodis TaxID=1937191 RepID=A0A4R0XWT7_9MOLU|nr:ABC transporter permease [Mycoplasma todarodis]TCG11451.1 hypothetical protein C4B25_01545 [Mycoplasma todarodis]
MFKYMRLQLFLVSKKISTYIVPVVFAVAFFLMMGIPIIIAKSEGATSALVGSSLLNNPLMLMLPFIISALFVAIKALNIFKDSEEDGTELLIVSKPITRLRIVLGKFASLYTLIFLFSIFAFVIVALISLIDSNATSVQRFEYAASIAFGTFIIQVLLSSIIVFFASVLGKIGTMTLSILIPLILSITSVVLIPLSGATLSSGGGEYTYEYVKQDKSGNFKVEKMYGYRKDRDYSQDRIDKHEKTWYKSAAYFDVWTQLSSFYSIFHTGELSPNSLSNWRRTDKVQKISELVDPHTIYKDAATGNIYQLTFLEKGYTTTPAENLKSLNYAKDIYPLVSKDVAQKLDSLTAPLNDDYVLPEITQIINQSNHGHKIASAEARIVSMYVLMNLLNEHKLKNSLSEIVQSGNLRSINSGFITNIYDKEHDEYVIIEGKHYIPKALLYFLWIAITLGVGGLVMLRYIRRDFK